MIVSVNTDDIDAMKLELEYLRFWKDKAYDSMGPGSDDVDFYIEKEWIDLGNELPSGYGPTDC